MNWKPRAYLHVCVVIQVCSDIWVFVYLYLNIYQFLSQAEAREEAIPQFHMYDLSEWSESLRDYLQNGIFTK